MMGFLRKRDINQTTNDYYHEYKSTLQEREEPQNLFSLSDSIKVGLMLVMLGLMFIAYNNFISPKIEFSKAQNGHESNLLEREQHPVKIPIVIQEEKVVEQEVATLSKKLNMDSADIKLIIEAIHLELRKQNKTPLLENRR